MNKLNKMHSLKKNLSYSNSLLRRLVFVKNANFVRNNKSNGGSYDESNFSFPKSSFVDGKYTVLTKDNFKYTGEKIIYYSTTPVFIFLTYKVVTKFLKFQVFRGLLWLGALLFYSRIATNYYNNRKIFVISFNLLEDGKRVEVTTPAEKKIHDISCFRELDKQEKEEYAITLGSQFGLSFYPIIIQDHIYLISTKATINNGHILSLIQKGKYVKIDKDITLSNNEKDTGNGKNKDKIIDI
jgi:hypothetical protein